MKIDVREICVLFWVLNKVKYLYIKIRYFIDNWWIFIIDFLEVVKKIGL